MFLKKYLTTSPKIRYPATKALFELFRGPKIDGDKPLFTARVSVREGATLDGVANATKVEGSNSYVVDFVSLNSLKKLVENPAVQRLSEFGARPETAKPAPKGPRPF
jgi:hypothetical protein